jgi:hypothetical protein
MYFNMASLRHFIILAFITTMFVLKGYSQFSANYTSSNSSEQEPYSTLNVEAIFTFSNYPGNIGRFTIFPNINYPIFFVIGRNKFTIIESGINLRNVGIIYSDSFKVKNRSISLGIPIKYDLVLFRSHLLSIGFDLDFQLFNKQIKYETAGQIKTTSFTSSNVNLFHPAATIEYSMTHQLRLKFNYYFSNYFSSQYNSFSDSPSNIFYFSIVLGVFTSSTGVTRISIL